VDIGTTSKVVIAKAIVGSNPTFSAKGYYMQNIKIELQDLEDLRNCGKFYWGDINKRNLFFSLKDAILKKYGFQYGYTLQCWDDIEYWDSDDEYGDIYSTHQHILGRYYLSTQDGNYISYQFHIPINEFCYYTNDGYYSKVSENFSELKKLVTDIMIGKKKKIRLEKNVLETEESLDRLTNKFGFLLENKNDI
jgi:hypothetical protein